jgi:hypothetical protein
VQVIKVDFHAFPVEHAKFNAGLLDVEIFARSVERFLTLNLRDDLVAPIFNQQRVPLAGCESLRRRR